MTRQNVRVLIVDDTALYRKVLRDVLEAIPGVEVIGSAPNGKIALNKLEQLQPDMMTLDVEMPEMNGLETLKNLRFKPHKPAVIMVSSLTQRDAEVTMQALQLGAFDFIAKPSGSSIFQNIDALREQFIPKVEMLRKKMLPPQPFHETVQKTVPVQEKQAGAKAFPARPARVFTKPRIVALGISTGGPRALGELIPLLPQDFPVPLVLVQHMPPVFTKALADSLNKKSAVTVLEAEDNMSLQAGTVYVAPGGKQMKIAGNGLQPKIKITDDPPENHCKPSADYLFRSVNEIFAAKTLGVIMTGMGRDGTEGLRLLKQSGAYNLAQDENTCVVYGMPMEAVKAGVVDEVLPLKQIAERITKIVKG